MAKKGKKRQKLGAKEKAIDRISSLPDFILTDILSHLPLYSAVATSILSRRWRYLWTYLTHLNFDPLGTRNRPYVATINRLLPLFTSPKIHSLCIHNLPYVYSDDNNLKFQSCSSPLQSWITDMCNRFVERIEVSVCSTSPYESSFSVPSCMFQCQSLTTLSLRGAFRFNTEFVVSLPKLTKLDFRLHVLESLLLIELSKSCPLLEHLSLQAISWELSDSVDISTLCLKKLCIVIYWNTQPPQGKLVINASKLEDIALEGLCLGYLCFVNPSGALVTANMALIPAFMDYKCNSVEFAELMSSATTLRLNSTTLNAISNLNDHLLPHFDNLSDLNIEVDDIDGSWNDLLVLLRCSPKLESLTLALLWDEGQVIKWVVPDYTPCGLINLKSIDILRLKGNTDDYMMIKYILSNAKSLEQLSVDVRLAATKKEAIEFCDKLFLLESSSSCLIQVSGEFGVKIRN